MKNEKALDHSVIFEPAPSSKAEFLTELGLRSNAFYRYRSVSDGEARLVFLVQEHHFKEGIVRLMKLDGKIIGFYGLICSKEKEGREVNILSHFFLEPQFIGKGYGKHLFWEAMRVAKEELKWEALQWESDPYASWFYQKMGAKRIGTARSLLNPKYRVPIFVYILNE